MTPYEAFLAMCAEVERFALAEASGRLDHPGVRLRFLLAWNLSEGDQRDSFAQEIWQAFCSLESVARAFGVSVQAMSEVVDECMATEVARRIGFSRATLFMEGGESCALH